MLLSVTIWLVALAFVAPAQLGLAQSQPRRRSSQPQPPGLTPLSESKSPRQIAQEAFPSVVLLVMQDANGQPITLGSGFVLQDGLVATNHHVISGTASGYCKLVGKNVTYAISGTVAVDALHDLSIVEVPGLKASALPIGDSAQVAVGDAVYAIGNPEGLEGTFSQGIVSAVRRVGNDTMLQITAPISSGSSGGPILDSSGRVIGIAVATFKEGQNLNLAVPSFHLTALVARISANVLPLSRQQARIAPPSGAQPTPEDSTLPSIAHLRAAAEHGDANAQFSLGRAYLMGQGVSKNQIAAFRWYRKAAEQGHASAESMLGTFYYSGEGVPKNLNEALRWFRKAAEQGDSFAEHGLGVLFAEGAGVPQNDVDAAKWYRKSAEHGNALGQLQLGVSYASGLGVLKDYSEAAKWYRKAAEHGNSFAQELLAELYYNGEGVEKDYGEAVQWYRKAAEQGDVSSSRALGTIYAAGLAVTQDYSKSLNWYRKAAEQGDAGAQTAVGHLYFLGKGVRQDSAEAAKWYRKAADQGYVGAQFELGSLYSDPRNGFEDYPEGAKWLRKAAEQGHERAQVSLGLAYQYGKGVPQDYVQAHIWFNLAAANAGELQEQAAKWRDEVTVLMTREQIAEAQRLAREWKATRK